MGDAYQIKDQAGTYFLTFQVVGWADVFTRRKYRDIVMESMEYCRKEKGLRIYAYVVMSNHLHVIWRSETETLSDTVRDFKKYTSKRILKELQDNLQESRKEWLEMIFKYHAKYNKRAGNLQLWTHENHAVELTTNKMVQTRIDYIHDNPVRTGWVERPEEYLYSSAKNYCDEEGLIEIDLITGA